MSAPYSNSNPYKRLVQLLDVDAVTLSDGEVLAYNTTDGLWKAGNDIVVGNITVNTLNATVGNITTVNSTGVNATNLAVNNMGHKSGPGNAIQCSTSLQIADNLYAPTVSCSNLQSFGGLATNINVLDNLTLLKENYIKCRTFFNTTVDQGNMIMNNFDSIGYPIYLQTRGADGTYSSLSILKNILTCYNISTGTLMQLRVSPSVVNDSDSRMKHQIKPLDNALDKLAELEIKTYMKSGKLNSETDADGNVIGQSWREYGVIAQQALKTSFEFAVDVPEDLKTESYAISYNNLFVAGLKATQELNVIVKAQGELITKQSDLIANLEARLTVQESK